MTDQTALGAATAVPASGPTDEAVRKEPSPGESSQELVTCLLGEVEFGMDINAVQEIVRLPKITPVPKAPAYVRGLANLRGNVLPIIDPRIRFGIARSESEQNCRVVVLELNGAPTGLIVDAVREVMYVREDQIEPPPPVVQGVDSKFLSGVAKLEDGRRLVMLIDQDQVIHIEGFDVATAKRSAAGSSRSSRAEAAANSDEDHEQLVTFRLADEEFAISIMDVKEIIRVPAITRSPNAPAGVEGITSLRDRVLPVLNLRTKFGQRTLAAEMEALTNVLRDLQAAQLQQAEALEASLSSGIAAEIGSYDESRYGRWRARFVTRDPLVLAMLDPLDAAFRDFHVAAARVASGLTRGDASGSRDASCGSATAAQREIDKGFKKLLRGIARRDDERCLVIGVGGASLALRIDAVNEVLQAPRESVETTPAAVAGTARGREQIRGVAKLDDGQRLIMLLDAEKLVSESELAAIQAAKGESTAAASHEGETMATNRNEEDERQFVSFRVGDEEFATDIMLVQEIVRLAKVTKVPHAPSFVEGVVNLRGNVLPVIDLRRRFQLESAAYNDATRVVVIDSNDRKTGIIVDAVSEVLSLPAAAIEAAPPIVQAGFGEDLIEGVGKIDGGARMLLILKTGQLLSEEDLAALQPTGGKLPAAVKQPRDIEADAESTASLIDQIEV